MTDVDDSALMPSREDGCLTQYAIYDHPRDHPTYYVVRPWDIRAGECKPRQVAGLFKELENARLWCEQLGLVCLGRHDYDDKCLLELWT
jgi:hypothetical protein